MSAPPLLTIDRDLTDPDVVALLASHLADMRAVSPPESVHALDLDALRADDITFLVARDADHDGAAGALLGVGALKVLDDPDEPGGHGEVKSMRTTHAAVRRGVATAVLLRLLEVAREQGLGRVSLETGAEPFFEPARRFYARHGFTPCPPFVGYAADPNSVFLSRAV
ncbi:GNAT family N-acetyltransferase [Nocardioides zeae]|uniref:GNAT family N-acetyltransferase n=1 Tax=Nocardioides imazamoxiresistens TaxID=3231893 RepID=A0ABU3PXJ2_9ACTN|nr:GNAT family N-acetyltransferase [Nocardioides zeae]MDT9593962.1 GNAT family N-acetyltransferase [Nocardioides zeae]